MGKKLGYLKIAWIVTIVNCQIHLCVLATYQLFLQNNQEGKKICLNATKLKKKKEQKRFHLWCTKVPSSIIVLGHQDKDMYLSQNHNISTDFNFPFHCLDIEQFQQSTDA